MIINSAPADKAVFGGITKVSEFKIKNSAKAFGILSSGLYANKIRAIIRELSCNAVDSHVAAGKRETPFELHLPTRLQPYFSIRDYGIGLNLEDVTHIYTTYFESTKADSNEFIGALGLGSKSPFSYTDSFTVIAIKDGIKGIFSAFINDEGVPSVAEMGVEETDEPAGVEVKFAVTDNDDFWRFSTEAKTVFTYFEVMPIMTGTEVTLQTVEYSDKAIIPGVFERKNSGRGGGGNYAIMGNIAYPIDIPGAERKLGDLEFINDTGLDIIFALGDIEFQASREGLQYTDATVDAIKAKYKEIADALAVSLEAEANDFDNVWDRVQFLSKKSRSALWSGVVSYYVKNNKVPFLQNKSYYSHAEEEITIKKIAEEFNVQLRVFSTDSSYHVSGKVATEMKPHYNGIWKIQCASNILFITNVANKKMWERSKHHSKITYKNNMTVFVIYANDIAKPVDTAGFFKSLYSPPTNQIIDVADLTEVDRTQRMAAKITLLRVNVDRYGSGTMTWTEASQSLANMDTTKTYCYIPITGFLGSSKTGKDIDVKHVYKHMRHSDHPKLCNIDMYGVRKDQLAAVQALPNWVRYDDLIEDVLGELKPDNFLGMVLSWEDSDRQSLYYNKKFVRMLDKKSPMRLFCKKLPEEPVRGNRSLFELSGTINGVCNLKLLEETATKEIKNIQSRYSMIQQMQRGRNYDEPIVAEYINLVDQHKGLT